jgi:hypothetical protein
MKWHKRTRLFETIVHTRSNLKAQSISEVLAHAGIQQLGSTRSVEQSHAECSEKVKSTVFQSINHYADSHNCLMAGVARRPPARLQKNTD